MNRIQVTPGKPVMRKIQEATPRSGMRGLKGTLKVRCLEGSLTRRIMMPKHTKTNAKRVPIFVKSITSSIFVKAAIRAIRAPVTMVVT